MAGIIVDNRHSVQLGCDLLEKYQASFAEKKWKAEEQEKVTLTVDLLERMRDILQHSVHSAGRDLYLSASEMKIAQDCFEKIKKLHSITQAKDNEGIEVCLQILQRHVKSAQAEDNHSAALAEPDPIPPHLQALQGRLREIQTSMNTARIEHRDAVSALREEQTEVNRKMEPLRQDLEKKQANWFGLLLDDEAQSQLQEAADAFDKSKQALEQVAKNKRPILRELKLSADHAYKKLQSYSAQQEKIKQEIEKDPETRKRTLRVMLAHLAAADAALPPAKRLRLPVSSVVT